ncbi:MAG TPA: ABC transporter permease, partial [Iamia sp.]|nr:ABC transporter permease [Iamia sp.]
MKLSRLILTLAAPALALVVALVLSALALVLTGNSVLDVLQILWDQVTNIGELVNTVNRAAPYYVSGVAVAIGFKMNLFNIGVEGQYRLGGLVGAAAGAALPLPGPLRLVGILVVAMLVGGLWAGIAGVLRAYRGVSEVIATIMLNAIALGLTPFLLTRYFADEGGAASFTVRTELIPKGGHLPRLDFLVLGDAGRAHLSGYLVIAILVGVVYWVLVWRSRFGFDLRASGANPHAARASGVDAKRMTVLAMLISGAIAGMVGLSFVLSESHRYTEESFLAGFGFTGIAIALLGRNNPV